MTVHAAKGLEFPYVFLCGLNEGIFPSRKTKTEQAMEEERRLAFVAVTRARKRLYLSAASGLNFDASIRYPSRFLLELDDSLLEYANPIAENIREDALGYVKDLNRWIKRESTEQKTTFAKGSKISHRILGEAKGNIFQGKTDENRVGSLVKTGCIEYNHNHIE